MSAGSVAGNLASGTVPEPRLEALSEVKAEPFFAGSVDGNLSSGTVPDDNCEALRLVSCDPPPEKPKLPAITLSAKVATVFEAKVSAVLPALSSIPVEVKLLIVPPSILSPDI